MKKKLILSTLVLLCFVSGSVLGSVVGKIVGTVTDAETNEPMVGVTVTVQGTSMGAMTDVEGNYVIMNVPVGTYVLALSTVGYATVEIENVQVSADLASYHDQVMSSRAADLGTTIKVVAERPLIMKDKTTTVDIVEREQLLAMPVRGFEQVVGIQNSVVRMNAGSFGQRQRGQRSAQANSQELNLRGGRPSEVAYYVDGFSQQDPLTGVSTANINNNAIKEISVTSGAFSAEYGHVASGVVNVITNSGSSEYHGNVEVVTDNVLKDNFDHNYYSADFGGPIPGMEKGTFFLSGERRYLRDRTPSSKTEEMHTVQGAPFGLDTLYEDNPQRLPSNSLSGWSYQGKMDYAFNPNVKLSLSGNGSVDYWREYRQEWALNSDHAPRYEDKNLGLNAKITHTLSAETFYNFSTSYFKTERTRGDGIVFGEYDAYERFYEWDDGEVDDVVNPEFDDYSLFWTPEETITVVANPDTAFVDTTIGGVDTTLTVITVDSVELDESSYYAGYLHQISSYVGFKGDINHQLDDNNTIKAGFDFQRHTLRFFQNLDATKGPEDNLLNRYGFDVNGEESDDEDYENETKHPINLGMYITDRLDWRGLVVNAGLRFDYFDYKALRIINLEQPFGEDNSTLDREDLEDSEKFYRLSPRLGISFPISDVTQMHINYGKFYQRPDLIRLYVGYNFYEAHVDAGSYYPFASPNLEPEKTTQYEVGVTHQLADNVAFGITAYYKDVQDLTQIFHQTPASPTVYDFYANSDYGTIKGVDFSLTMRRTRNLQMDLRYTLSYANGTGSYANTQYIIAWQNPDGQPKSTHPLDYDQRHNINGMFDFRLGEQEGPRLGDIYPLENMGLNVIVSAGSGTPYTPTQVYDEATENAVNPKPLGSVNSANKPWIFSIDLKLERKVKIAGYSVTPYVWVKNLLDTENAIGVYEGTGEADVNGYLNTDEGSAAAAADADYENRYELKQANATNYMNPRMVYFGLRFAF